MSDTTTYLVTVPDTAQRLSTIQAKLADHLAKGLVTESEYIIEAWQASVEAVASLGRNVGTIEG